MMSFFKRKKEDEQASVAPVASAQPKEGPTNREILQTITRMQRELDRLKMVLTNGEIEKPLESEQIVEDALREIQTNGGGVQKNENEKIVEGVFDGESMIGSDGEKYDVPANYASKSKLVEGDILKLSVNNFGSFVYKQIKPIERTRKVGTLEQDEQSLQFYAVDEGKKWKLLTASVTYFKGEDGDEIVFLIPTEGGSRWAAVENIMK
jgi:hypothetical protein